MMSSNLSSSSLRPKTPPSASSSKIRKSNDASSPPTRPTSGHDSPPFKSYLSFMSNTNDDWKADEEDDIIGYEEDDGDDFGLPGLSNMKRRSRRIATQGRLDHNGSLSPAIDGSFPRSHSRRYSNSADIAIERPASSYPMPKKSEGKILRPQYKEILKGV
jgi:TBC1 domain family member 2